MGTRLAGRPGLLGADPGACLFLGTATGQRNLPASESRPRIAERNLAGAGVVSSRLPVFFVPSAGIDLTRDLFLLY